MIKDNCTIDGIPIDKIPGLNSKRKIIRICDKCKKEDEREYRQIIQARLKYNTKQDFCCSCGLKEHRKKPTSEHKHKVRLAVRKRYQDPYERVKVGRKGKENLRYKDNRRNIHKGSLVRYENGKTIFVHRENYEKFYNYKIQPGEHVHHINCDSLDNSKENLIVANNRSDHKLMHSSLEKTAAELVKRKIILFDRLNKSYFINPNIDNITMERSLNFHNIAIMQGENICQSRLDVNIESEIIHGIKRPIGLIAANMSSVCNADFCIELYKLGALGILHRAADKDWILNEIKKISKQCDLVAASIGVSDDQFDLVKEYIKLGVNIVTIDIAHGFSQRVADLAKKIKEYSKEVKIIVGNFTNPECFKMFYKYVDAFKIGIANGLACETKNTAGCNEGQFSVIRKFTQLSKDFNIPIISDGGIREPGDFTKATLAGANSSMAGSIFARCPESAAETIYIDDKPKKIYAGMSSRYVQDRWRGGLKSGTCPEGKTIYLDMGESVSDLLERYSGALRSGITYVGASNIIDAQNKVKFVQV